MDSLASSGTLVVWMSGGVVVVSSCVVGVLSVCSPVVCTASVVLAGGLGMWVVLM